jgi:hypothetical protein
MQEWRSEPTSPAQILHITQSFEVNATSLLPFQSNLFISSKSVDDYLLVSALSHFSLNQALSVAIFTKAKVCYLWSFQGPFFLKLVILTRFDEKDITS